MHCVTLEQPESAVAHHEQYWGTYLQSTTSVLRHSSSVLQIIPPEKVQVFAELVTSSYLFVYGERFFLG